MLERMLDAVQTQSSSALPVPENIATKDFTDLLMNRRTCRNYACEAISQQTLSTVLFHTAGAIYELETDEFGTVLLKAAPSPGARHATEVYAYVNNCTGLVKGVYHYCVEHHKLNLIRLVDPDFITRALLTQPYFEDAAVVFFFTSVVARAMWKYKATRIYRLLHLEVGHYCQNLLLSGTALGLGVFQTGALDDNYIEHVLGIDGRSEFLMYAAGMGLEKASPTGSHRVKLRTTVPRSANPKPYRDFEKFRQGE